MFVTVNVLIGPVLHPVKPGSLIAIQAAVGPHPGLGSANPALLIFQAAKFPRRNLARLHALIDATLLVHLPLVQV